MSGQQRTQNDLGIALLRLAIGLVLLVHGAGKLLGVGPTATDLAQFAGFLGSLGVPLPSVFAPVVGVVETVGGLFVLVGVATRYAAVLIAADMLVATVLVHLPRGFSVSNGGYEFTLTLFLVSLSLVFLGPGAFSIERSVLDGELTVSSVGG